MLKIRLQRVGRKNDASFRVVVTESTKGPKAGNAVEVLGFYDPKRDISEIKKDRVEYWMSVGAQVSDTVHNLFVGNKIIEGDKVNVLPKKSPIKKEKEENNAEEGASKTPVTEEVTKETPDDKEKSTEVSEEEEKKEEVKETASVEEAQEESVEEEKKKD